VCSSFILVYFVDIEMKHVFHFFSICGIYVHADITNTLQYGGLPATVTSLYSRKCLPDILCLMCIWCIRLPPLRG